MASTLKILPLLLLLILNSTADTFADTINYTGVASKDGILVYTEQHSLTYNTSAKLISAETLYLNSKGEKIAKLISNFESSLTAPDHILENFQTGNIQGIRRDKSNIVLFSKDKNATERLKILDNSFSNKMLMGCQGLNYFLVENLDKMQSIKVLPIRFLIPAKLDYFDFTIRYIDENPNGIINFEISIDSWFLKLFSSNLYVKYDKNLKRIINYKGLSNIPDNNGKMQVVEIIYKAS